MDNGVNTIKKVKLYDLAKLSEMLDANEIAVNTFVKKFINTTPHLLSDLNESSKKKNYPMIRKALYNINFSFEILGINALKNDFKNIELFTTDKSKFNELLKLINKINNLFDKVLKQLEDENFENKI
jgi:hypothetical protein